MLITVVIIGVIASITIPVMMNSYKWKVYRTGLFKAKSVLDQAVMKYYAENGILPKCGYWKKNPYLSSNGGSCNAVCGEYTAAGSCKKWVCRQTGNSIPDDYNGNFADCVDLYNFFLKNMNVIKVCNNNAYRNGCIPEYGGNDTAYNTKNPDKSDYEVNQALAGCNGWNQNKILSGMAFVTADGMIFFPYSGVYARLMAVDVNGQKGPNKWGHDIHPLTPKMSGFESDIRFFPGGGCEFIEYGGVSGAELLYGKNYM